MKGTIPEKLETREGSMNLLHELSLVIQRSHSLHDILENAVALIVSLLRTDVCSIYLIEPPSGKLVLRATHGLDKSAVDNVRLEPGEGLTGTVVKELRTIAVEDASVHPNFVYFPETGEERYKSFLGVPMAIRNRAVGALVVQSTERRPYNQEEVQMLYTIAAQLVGVVESARLIEALDRGDEGVQYLNEVRAWHSTFYGTGISKANDIVLHGSAASPGIAIAEVVIRGAFELRSSDRKISSLGEDTERTRVRGALERTRDELLRIQKEAEKQADEEHALIFSSHLLLLNDSVLLGRIDDLIRRGATAAVAVDQALGEFEARLGQVSDPYILDRLEDIRDLRSRLLGHLLYAGRYSPMVSDRVVVSGGTPPSLVVELKAKGARALVTEHGGATSHGALLARSMGIPAVTGARGIRGLVRTGDVVIVDGTTGQVILRPSTATLERYERVLRTQELRRTSHRKYCCLPARTADGDRVRILANIGVAADLAVANENGAEGIGLYRTEFPFLIREQFPTRAEQVRIYSKAYAVFQDRPINFRLLDLGGDKFLPQGNLRPDRDPFHGYRSIRVLLDHPEVLRDQVQAFALAAGSRPLRIVLPMISSMEEFLHARELIHEAVRQLPPSSAQTRPSIGVMIELPAAVEIARHLAQEADFFSIGTNDLIQYTLAVDRENGRTASARDPYHPAILRMVNRVVNEAHSEGIAVSVCGEMASDWRLALLLTAMGVDSVSVTPAAILELKEALIQGSLGSIKRRLDAILSLPDAATIEAQLEEILPAVADSAA